MLPTFKNERRMVPSEVFISYSPYGHTGRISAVVVVDSMFPKSQCLELGTIPSVTKVRPFGGLYWRCEPTLGRGVGWAGLSADLLQIHTHL